MPSLRAPEFGPEETRAAEVLVDLAIEEDLGTAGDLTSLATIPESHATTALIVAREPVRIAGLPILGILLGRIGEGVLAEYSVEDGARVEKGESVARLTGPTRAILGLERIALNFLQRLSGVATQTSRFVDLVQDLGVEVLDTRKTTPGFRVLEKYAVRLGGGKNHRIGLFDAILIKDNHLAALAGSADPVGEAIRLARAKAKPGVVVEVEVDTLEQFSRALDGRPDIVLLDNFDREAMILASKLRNERARSVRLEASGGVRLDTVREIAETGIDRISVGALTHSARAVDLALDFEPRADS